MKIHVTIEANPRAWRRPRRRVLVAAVVLSLLLPAAVLANHDFTDVPTSDQFHTQISAIKGAGITTGCTATTYCPTEFVRRDAMAAFMQRGYGRVAQSGALSISSISNADGNKDIGSVTITVPGVSGTQFVRVEGSVNLFGTIAGCPCNVGYGIAEGPGSGGTLRTYDQLPTSGYNQRTMVVSYVFPAASGVHTYYMSVSTDSVAAVGLRVFNISATTHTFGSAGTTTLGAGSAAKRPAVGINGK